MAIIALLIVAHSLGAFSKHVLDHDYVFGLVPIFDLNGEFNIPTSYATLALLGASYLLFRIAFSTFGSRKKYAINWLVLALGFLFMGFDEFFLIHESATAYMKSSGDYSGAFHFAWVVPYAIGVLVIGLSMVKFLLYLPAATRTYFLVAGTLFVGGAVGFELLEGLRVTHTGRDVVFDMLCLVEESLEMSGVALFIFALILHRDAAPSESLSQE